MSSDPHHFRLINNADFIQASPEDSSDFSREQNRLLGAAAVALFAGAAGLEASLIMNGQAEQLLPQGSVLGMSITSVVCGLAYFRNRRPRNPTTTHQRISTYNVMNNLDSQFKAIDDALENAPAAPLAHVIPLSLFKDRNLKS